MLTVYKSNQPGHACMTLKGPEDLLVGLASNLKVPRNLKVILL